MFGGLGEKEKMQAHKDSKESFNKRPFNLQEAVISGFAKNHRPYKPRLVRCNTSNDAGTSFHLDGGPGRGKAF